MVVVVAAAVAVVAVVLALAAGRGGVWGGWRGPAAASCWARGSPTSAALAGEAEVVLGPMDL